MQAIPPENSHLYMALGGKLVAVIGIADPVKEEACQVIEQLTPSRRRPAR